MMLVAVSAAMPARAQLFGPESLSGAFLGTFIGGMAGSDCHHGFSGEGAAIGAGVGFIAGALVGEVNRRAYYQPSPYVYYPPAPVAQPGYGYVAPATVYTYAPPPPPLRPNYAVGGTAVGALAGGLIGAANHKGWEGAGIGAASGLVVGTIAEVAARKQEQKQWSATASQTHNFQPESQGQPTPPPMRSAAPPQQARPQMTVASATTTSAFSKQPQVVVHQIPDAPRVPDAPSF